MTNIMPTQNRRCSSTATGKSSLQDLEIEYSSLRDEELRYEDDAQFHIFIDTLELVDAVVPERTPHVGRRRSLGQLLVGLRRRKERIPSLTTSASSQ